MIKRLLGFGVIAALFACSNAPQENNEEHTHDAEEVHAHDHGTVDDANATSAEDRLVINEGAHVFFVNLKDGDVVQSPFQVEMGVEGMEIKPAGEAISGTGHHHILINNEVGYHELGTIVPADDFNIHFGKGQTSTSLELAPGEYSLSLQFANGFHESYGEALSASIHVIVE